MNLLGRYISDFGALIFPNICYACGTTLSIKEKDFCNTCLHQLPYTNFHLHADNKIAKQFWGRVEIESAAAYLYFNKGGHVQNIMHQLKYNKQAHLGVKLGKMYAQELIKLNVYASVEAIVPVPLHPHKLTTRGYNQSEQFAIGLSQVLNIPVNTNLLTRTAERESQASKNRASRFDNMQKVFLANSVEHDIKNVLLVDDTITTGATLEACAIALKEIGVTTINILGIAFTE